MYHDNDDKNNEQNKDNNNKKKIIKRKKRKKKQNKQTKKTNTITTNKTLTYNRQNIYREERENKLLIYYIQTIKRLLCLICSINITFIKTKRSICL